MIATTTRSCSACDWARRPSVRNCARRNGCTRARSRSSFRRDRCCARRRRSRRETLSLISWKRCGSPTWISARISLVGTASSARARRRSCARRQSPRTAPRVRPSPRTCRSAAPRSAAPPRRRGAARASIRPLAASWRIASRTGVRETLKRRASSISSSGAPGIERAAHDLVGKLKPQFLGARAAAVATQSIAHGRAPPGAIDGSRMQTPPYNLGRGAAATPVCSSA